MVHVTLIRPLNKGQGHSFWYQSIDRLLHSYLRRCVTASSAFCRQLLVPRQNLSTYGRRAVSVAGLAAWNCLCDELRVPLLTANSFRQLLKTRLFVDYSASHYALYKYDYLLTYLYVYRLHNNMISPARASDPTKCSQTMTAFSRSGQCSR